MSPFSEGTLVFLQELAQNNTRAWFEENKARYESLVREPARACIRALAPTVEAFSFHFVASDAKVGGSLMRVHRDVRFSPNKAPYKTHIGIQFRHVLGKDVHAPGLYIHISPEEFFVAAGMWHPEPAALQKVREAIVEQPEVWAEARNHPDFTAHWSLSGESVKRMPRGFDVAHPHAEDLKRKDHIAVYHAPVASVLAPDLLDRVSRSFLVSKPFMAFLAKALGLPF
jgi:uncharacterized protein (TIGR02453 family)